MNVWGWQWEGKVWARFHWKGRRERECRWLSGPALQQLNLQSLQGSAGELEKENELRKRRGQDLGGQPSNLEVLTGTEVAGCTGGEAGMVLDIPPLPHNTAFGESEGSGAQDRSLSDPGPAQLSLFPHRPPPHPRQFGY